MNYRNVLSFFYSAYAVFCYLVIFLLLLPVFLLLPFVAGEERAGNLLLRICRLWARVWYVIVGISYKEIRTGDIVEEVGPFVYIANHNSYADIASLVCSVREPVRILGRHDIGRIPLVGYYYQKLVIAVDRTDPVSKAESMLSLNRYIRNGGSIFIFPEGGFNNTGALLADFQNGAFRIAIENKIPIKPLLFLDNGRILPQEGPMAMQPGVCRVVSMCSVDVTGYDKSRLNELKQLVVSSMAHELMKYEVI